MAFFADIGEVLNKLTSRSGLLSIFIYLAVVGWACNISGGLAGMVRVEVDTHYILVGVFGLGVHIGMMVVASLMHPKGFHSLGMT